MKDICPSFFFSRKWQCAACWPSISGLPQITVSILTSFLLVLSYAIQKYLVTIVVYLLATNKNSCNKFIASYSAQKFSKFHNLSLE